MSSVYLKLILLLFTLHDSENIIRVDKYSRVAEGVEHNELILVVLTMLVLLTLE